ncbi:unnamed protein product [Mycena citricolor]|uniref:FAD-binding domain-containing protein n=1 Tax=Mycena citricolor TaxID=2018698 RepID=A0AAD2H8W3_9AGAR|nr:unnamed protein product [Mycena citricolor]CAK5271693.1 unnamed protein product [Mycena citricolor]
MSAVPEKTTVLVIGGGPAGSYSASVLARHGIEVTILEGAKFPRYHIGESLLASTNYFLEFIGAREKVLAHGFMKKPGGLFKMRRDFPTVYTNFVDHSTGNHAVNVERAKYDDILFRHAESQGAKIFDEHKVTSLRFSPDDSDRPIAAEWSNKSGGKGVIAFDYLVDASGRYGVMSDKYHKDRKITESLKNIAIWGYWKGNYKHGQGTEREGAILVETLHDHTGWAWFIPMTDDTVSIGACIHEKHMKEKKAGKTQEQVYHEVFSQLEIINEAKADTVLQPNKAGGTSPVAMASDFSYLSENVGAKNYRLVGDAAAFIDPFFSNGVHIAFVGALSAALSIISVMEGKATEEVAADFHTRELKTVYMRFFLVVAAAYRQMRGGEIDILNDVDEKTFDHAFELIRPVIQGTGDIGQDSKSSGNAQLTDSELHAAMEFVFKLFPSFYDQSTDDLGTDARERLACLRGQLAFDGQHQGVKMILDGAFESMKCKVTAAKVAS